MLRLRVWVWMFVYVWSVRAIHLCLSENACICIWVIWKTNNKSDDTNRQRTTALLFIFPCLHLCYFLKINFQLFCETNEIKTFLSNILDVLIPFSHTQLYTHIATNFCTPALIVINQHLVGVSKKTLAYNDVVILVKEE